jgi:ABC-2 type transport system ATP-binding protein
VAIAIRTEGLTKDYRPAFGGRPIRALSGLSIEIREGETFGLVGPNGSGKTTALKLLLGLIFPTAGRAWIYESNLHDPAVKQRIGYLPEGPYYYPFLRGEELLRFYARLFGMDGQRAEQRINDLLRTVDMEKWRRTPLNECSRGMVQRFGLAQALLNDPDLLILDEPTSGLDPLVSYRIREVIAGLKPQGKTILLCSHLLHEVESLCDRIAILHQGEMRALGTLDELRALTHSPPEADLEAVFVHMLSEERPT